MATTIYRVIDKATSLFLRDDITFDSTIETGIISEQPPIYGTKSYWNGSFWEDTRTAQEISDATVTGVEAYNVKANKEQIALRVKKSDVGVPNGVASLDENGTVPTTQLPSYVDDVVEYNSISSFPSTGETGKIYVDLNSNKTYRWSGSQYTEISSSLAIGETTGTAYDGAKGKANADAIENKADKITVNTLTSRVDDVESDIDNVYTKTESDALLNDKTDKTTTDALTLRVTDNENNKADADNVYTKTESDALLADKADKSDVTALTTRVRDNETKINALLSKVYGFQINHITGDYARTDSAIGMSFGTKDGISPISSDFDYVEPWRSMRHVKIGVDGTKVEESNSNYDLFDGNIYTIIPAHYEYDNEVASVRTIKVSGSYFQGSTLVPEQTIGSMQASMVGSEVRSRVGETPKTNKSYTSFLTDMYAQGDGLHSMYNAQNLHTLFLLTTIESGTPDCQSAYGTGISASMPYSSSDAYKITVASTDANTVTLASAGQPFYVGMDVQIGTAYTNNSIASDRKITNIVDNGTTMIITVDGDSFSTSVGNAISTCGQSVSQDTFDAIGNGSGYILENESEVRSHVCYRGIWDLWGNCWQFSAGDMRVDGVHYVCDDKTKYNTSNPTTADGWTNTEFGEYAENGWQQERKAIKSNDSFFDVPVLWGNVANSGSYYSAYLYNFNSTYLGVRVLLVGGSWSSGSICSLVCSSGGGAPSSTGVYVSSRLIR